MTTDKIAIFVKLLEGTEINFEAKESVVMIHIKTEHYEALEITLQYTMFVASVELFGTLVNLDELETDVKERIVEYMRKDFADQKARGFALFYTQYNNLLVHVTHHCKDVTQLSSGELVGLVHKVSQICDELWEKYLS